MQKYRNKTASILLTTIILCVCVVSSAYGERIAVLPMEDLSFGVNGYDKEISALVVDEVAALGFEIVSDKEVMDFLVRNRLRWLGYLESYHVLLAKDELKADYLLLGTVNQRHEDGKSASVGLSLQLMRTSDSRVVWSDSNGISSADRQKLLGIGEPKTVRELMPDLVKTIFSSWPESFDFAEMEVSNIDIASVVLEPKYVKPGERVLCSVRLRENGTEGVKPQIFIQSGAQVHMAMEVPYLRNYELDKAMVVYRRDKETRQVYREAKSTDTLFQVANEADRPFNEAKQSDLPFNEADASGAVRYEAAWIGSDEQVAGYGVLDPTIKVAAATEDVRLLRSLWSSMDRDNRYPVSLMVSYPDGEQRTAFLGYYHVDSKPPLVSMRFKGKVIDGMVSFRESVTFLPRLQVPEPISRWRVTIFNLDEEKTVVDQEGDGILPPVLNWRGRKSDGLPAIDGRYLVSLYVWDRAGNMGEASQEVSYNALPPEPVFTVARIDEEKLGLQISQVAAVPIEFWRLEARYEDGSLIKFVDGEDFPSQVELPLTEDDLTGRKVEFSIVVKNILGGKTTKKVDDLVAFMKNDVKDPSDNDASPEDEEWVPDF